MWLNKRLRMKWIKVLQSQQRRWRRRWGFFGGWRAWNWRHCGSFKEVSTRSANPIFSGYTMNMEFPVQRQHYPGQVKLISKEDGKWAIRASTDFHFSCSSNLRSLWQCPICGACKGILLIEATTKRIEKTALLTAFLLLVIQRSAKGDTKSLLQAVYLCINRVNTCFCLHDLKFAEVAI